MFHYRIKDRLWQVYKSMLSVVDLQCRITYDGCTLVGGATVDLSLDASSRGIVMPLKHGVYKAGDHSLV